MKQALSAGCMVITAAAALMMLPAAMPAQTQQLNPCTDDFKTHCGGVTPGGGRMVKCYEENKSKMSADCIGWAETLKSGGQALKAACDDMLQARCRSEEGDPFAQIDCLQSNYIDLKPKCVQKLNEFKGRYPKPVR